MVAERRAEDSAVTTRTGQCPAKVEAELQEIGDDIFSQEFETSGWMTPWHGENVELMEVPETWLGRRWDIWSCRNRSARSRR
uniref:Uncharacterized protein n=1 Tax=Noctiluca scintillans TaxID=2966 RepID=A7WQ93_NOCSC|nr:unknown [Noctiluca scintillans]ABV22386.1 unknown [Noctiluca scintillans]